MDRATYDLVWQRAGNRCEYCLIPQELETFYTYQIEHIIARKHGGCDDATNLALACPFCNRHKGPNIAGLDPIDGSLSPLFNPRIHVWSQHFELVGQEIVWITAIGRATVRTLNMNAPVRVDLRGTMKA